MSQLFHKMVGANQIASNTELDSQIVDALMSAYPAGKIKTQNERNHLVGDWGKWVW